MTLIAATVRFIRDRAETVCSDASRRYCVQSPSFDSGFVWRNVGVIVVGNGAYTWTPSKDFKDILPDLDATLSMKFADTSAHLDKALNAKLRIRLIAERILKDDVMGQHYVIPEQFSVVGSADDPVFT